MPGMNGRAFAEQLKLTRPRTCSSLATQGTSSRIMASWTSALAFSRSLSRQIPLAAKSEKSSITPSPFHPSRGCGIQHAVARVIAIVRPLGYRGSWVAPLLEEHSQPAPRPRKFQWSEEAQMQGVACGFCTPELVWYPRTRTTCQVAPARKKSPVGPTRKKRMAPLEGRSHPFTNPASSDSLRLLVRRHRR
jgi:hypothetical protein